MRKNYRNANGDGCITKVKNNKKNPFRVRVTDIKTGKRESLGYYDSKSKAKEVLRTYLYNPYDLKFRTITFKELFELFKENKKKVVAETTFKSYINSYKRCKPLYNLIFKDISTPQMQNMINKLDCSIATKNITKGFLTILYNYARELDVLEKNRAEFIQLPKETSKKEKNIFTIPEIKKLWENEDKIWVDYILIMIYTGMRIGELVDLKKEHIDLLEGFIYGGNKTEKGKNRCIPIHKDILKLVTTLSKNSTTDYLLYNKKWVFSKKKNENKPLRINYFREKFYKTLESLNMNHKPHDCRKTLATFMSNQKFSNVIMTDILGHEDISTTKQYYIQSNKQNLKNSMNNLDFLKEVI